MDTIPRIVLLSALAEELRAQGSWCGETHLQKAVYLLQEAARVPLGFDFILYKHGPFSFDLRGQLTLMRADDFLEMVPQEYPYGPRLLPSNASVELRRRFRKTLARHEEQIRFVAESLGSRRVSELERLATALYVSRKMGVAADVESRAERLHALKSHIPIEQARHAVAQADQLLQDAPDC